jgi:hypothetical protein
MTVVVVGKVPALMTSARTAPISNVNNASIGNYGQVGSDGTYGQSEGNG